MSEEDGPVPSYAAVMRQRVFAFITVTGLNVCSGSMWWVVESIWKSNIRRYDQHSTRKEHPGLSIRKRPPETPYETIPMLHGTSGERRGAFPVTGLSSGSGEAHPTWFGTLRPVLMELNYFGQGVRQNTHKQRLDEQEQQAFDQWLQRRFPV